MAITINRSVVTINQGLILNYELPVTPSVTPSVTPTLSVTPSVTPTSSVTPTFTPTSTITPTPTYTPSATPPASYELIGYVGTPTYFPGNNAITGQTCTTPIYTSGLTLGQIAYGKKYYFDTALTNPLNETLLMYPFSTINGGNNFFGFRMDNAGGVGTSNVWGTYQKTNGYYVVSTTKVNVGNTNQFYSYSGDSGMYLGAFRFVSSTGAFPSGTSTYAWADTANITAQYLVTFSGTHVITLS